ncbi:hypothetical protein lerEdw1_019722 [Lerista edwardsae]|nr:hypothetical protein lerEdw1_019722 [Lerista edwardsae]
MTSSKTRYLIFFQYFGTKYSGVMRAPPDQAMLGVQNHLESLRGKVPSSSLLAPCACWHAARKAAEKLRPSAPIKFVISSRTDSGVHALCNAAHVDIERATGKMPFSEEVLREAFNRHLKPEPIRILGVRRVPSTFHARYSALSRTYVYRVAAGCSHPSELPVFERDLCWATCRGHLSLSAMQEAAASLVGTHDFSAFRSASLENPARSPVRTLIRAEVRPTCGFFSHHCEDRFLSLPWAQSGLGVFHLPTGLKFWELEFKGRSFLYKQVRRMVGVLVAVGQNRFEPHHVKRLLEAGENTQNTVAPAAGLFLKNVETDILIVRGRAWTGLRIPAENGLVFQQWHSLTPPTGVELCW